MGEFRLSGGKASAAALLLCAVLAGCGGTSTDGKGIGGEPIEAFTAEQIFGRAEYELNRRKFERAAEYFGEVERLYPYSAWAKRAAYAQYLLALSYYDQIDEVGRDQGLTFQALQSLRTVIERYPESDYARSSILKFDLAFDHLAAKEMEIGRYYLKRDHFSAAINRFRVVVEDFQTTTHTPEALHRLVEAYLSLGLTDEAQTAGAILGYNYQSTDWYEDSYRLLTKQGLETKVRGRNWLSNIYRQMIQGKWL